MSLIVKTFWISLLCLFIVGMVTLGMVGIPAKPLTVTKTLPNDQLPQ